MLYEAIEILSLGYYIFEQWMNVLLLLIPLFKEMFSDSNTKARSQNTQNHTIDYLFYLRVAGQSGWGRQEGGGLIWGILARKGDLFFPFKALNT